MKIRVGVVGLGTMGQHHVRLYSQLGCELVGVADVDSKRAKEIGEKYETSYYSDYHELLPRVDAVSIAVPTTLHHAVAMDFLNRGVHCLVEKPIAFSVTEADEMITAATSHEVNLAIGHVEMYNPAVLKLKQIIDEGTLGKLLIISTRRVGPFVSRIRDVGVVIDCATHDIGVVRRLIGKEPVGVFSRVGSLKHPKEDHAIIVLDFEDTTACIEVNWFTPYKVRTLVVTGSEGTANLDYIEQKLTVYNSHYVEVEDVRKTEPLKLELENFIRSITEGEKLIVDGFEGREILRIALECSKNTYSAIKPRHEISDRMSRIRQILAASNLNLT
ncbi:MAG: Gfo/Idh/MocA family oxidoreductase [Dehalococcoidales bacterium]